MSEQDGAATHKSMPGLDALLRATLQDCPDAILVRDDAQALSGRSFAALVQATATQLRQCGLVAGDRVLLAMDFGVPCLVALLAALRAGVEPTLVACGTRPIEMAARAKAAGAVALVGPTCCGPDEYGEAYLSAAAMSDTIRLVATLGPGEVDGAVDLSPTALQATAAEETASFGSEAVAIVTFERASATPIVHPQGALFALALALVDAAGISPSRPLLSTILPATVAGLVAGPFAAMIGASRLVLHGPFDAAAFLRACDSEPDAHLVVPAAVAPLLAEAGTTACASLILLSRHDSPGSVVLPPALAFPCPIVDLYAIGESALLSRRRAGGLAEAPYEGGEASPPGPLGAALNRARTASAAG